MQGVSEPASANPLIARQTMVQHTSLPTLQVDLGLVLPIDVAGLYSRLATPPSTSQYTSTTVRSAFLPLSIFRTPFRASGSKVNPLSCYPVWYPVYHIQLLHILYIPSNGCSIAQQ